MKDPGIELQKAYYSALDGNVTYNNNTVPVYDVVPAEPTYPYIQLRDKTTTQWSDKTHYGADVTQALSIIERFQGSFGSRDGVYSIQNDVQPLIVDRPQPLSITGFQIITSTVESTQFFRERTDTYTYYRVECRFRHRIQQN